MDIWLETDEHKEAVLALQLASEQLTHLESTDNPRFWNWVIVGLHSALQGYMVLALRGPNSLNVLTDKCTKEWLAAYESGSGKYPVQKLDGFMNLYKKIKSERMLMYDHSRVFKPSGTQGGSVKKLNSFRNDFIHFTPKGWRIEVSGLPQIVDDCLNIISFLAFECNNMLWNDQNLEEQTRELIDRAKESVLHIKQTYANKGI